MVSNSNFQVFLLILLFHLTTPIISQSTPYLRIYSGTSLPAVIGMDLSLQNNHYQISRVAFESRSLQFPLYYGVQAGIHTRIKNHWLRMGIEFLHDKIYARPEKPVALKTSDDPRKPPGRSYPFSDFLDSFSISHGLNYVLLTVSFPFLENPGGIQHLSLFSGLGVGVMIPHVESQWGEVRREQYEFHAPALMLHLNMEYRLTGRMIIFLGGKWGISRIRNARVVGGSVSLNPRAWHLVGGIGWGGGKKEDRRLKIKE